MHSIFLLLFIFCSLLLAVGTAPTLLPNISEVYELKYEMNIFRELLRKQLATAEEEVKALKRKNCKKKREYNNQKDLFKALTETRGSKTRGSKTCGSKNTAFKGLLFKVPASPNTAVKSIKASLLKI